MSAAALKSAVTGKPEPHEPMSPKIFRYLEDPRVVKGLTAVAGKFMQPERMLRLCVNAVKKTPRLLECDPQTVLGALMTSVSLGLEPNTVQQQAFLIPFKRRAKVGKEWVDVYDCQFQIGARGYRTLAYRSPLIKVLDAEAIYKGDHFKHRRGSGAFLEFETALVGRGPLEGAFSYVAFTSGAESSLVLPLEELHKIRARSETYRTLVQRVASAADDKERVKAERALAETPWVMWESEMASKSATKRHCKGLPISAGDMLAIASDLDTRSDEGTIDLSQMTDVDMVRSVVEDGEDPPLLDDKPSGEVLETGVIGGETFATREAAAVAAAASAKPKGKVREMDHPADTRSTSPELAREYVDKVKAAQTLEQATEYLDEARSVLTLDALQPVAAAYKARTAR